MPGFVFLFSNGIALINLNARGVGPINLVTPDFNPVNVT